METDVNRARSLMEILLEADRRIAAVGIGAPYPLYEGLHQTAARISPVDSCYICLYSPADETLFFPYNFDDYKYDDPITVPLGSGPTSWVVRHNSSLVLNEDTETAHRDGIKFGDKTRISYSAIHVPLRADAGDSQSAPLGVFSVQSYEPGVYDETMVHAVEWLGNRGGAVIAREREEDTWRAHLQAVEVKVAERKHQAFLQADSFSRMLRTLTREAEGLRSLVRPENAELRQAVEHLCRTCYQSQTEINQLPLRSRPVRFVSFTEEDHETDPLTLLTEREREILFLLARGESNPKIARQLHLSLGTVKFHCNNIYTKLGVGGRVEAVKRVVPFLPRESILAGRTG